MYQQSAENLNLQNSVDTQNLILNLFEGSLHLLRESGQSFNKQKEDADLVAHEEHDVYEYANFSHEIDLHIDNILDFPKKLNSAETMRLQLEYFDKYNYQIKKK